MTRHQVTPISWSFFLPSGEAPAASQLQKGDGIQTLEVQLFSKTGKVQIIQLVLLAFLWDSLAGLSRRQGLHEGWVALRGGSAASLLVIAELRVHV